MVVRQRQAMLHCLLRFSQFACFAFAVQRVDEELPGGFQ